MSWLVPAARRSTPHISTRAPFPSGGPSCIVFHLTMVTLRKLKSCMPGLHRRQAIHELGIANAERAYRCQVPRHHAQELAGDWGNKSKAEEENESAVWGEERGLRSLAAAASNGTDRERRHVIRCAAGCGLHLSLVSVKSTCRCTRGSYLQSKEQRRG